MVAGQTLAFTISATDPNNDSLTYSASNLPFGAAFSASTRIFSWTPASAGTYSNVRFQVSDGSLTDFEDITITVDGPPSLNPIGSRSIVTGQLLEFTVSAADPNNEFLTYSAFNLPSGASFNASTRTFSWKPTFGQAGTYANVHFEVSDGQFTDWEDITITVSAGANPAPPNSPPVFSAISNKSVAVNQLLEFMVSATDPDKDPLTYSASNLPSGASFNKTTRTFSWTPKSGQVGDFNNVRFHVSDGTVTVSESIAITVAKGDITAPKISSVNAPNAATRSVIISWITDEPSTSQVEYWANQRELSPLKEDFTTQHTVQLIGLMPDKTYRYRTLSRDRAGNLTISPEYSFTTLPAFTVSELNITPGEASVGEDVNISVLVTNNTDLPGSYDLVLRIANAKEATKTIDLAGGAKERVNFTTTRYATGEFTVDVNGTTDSLVVPSPPPKTANWPKFGMIAGGTLTVVISSVAGFLFYRRRDIFSGNR